MAAGRASAESIRTDRERFEGREGGEPRRKMLARVREYLRRDFHPGDTDELAMAHRRLAELGLDAAA